jgi:hypothetical protein
MLVAERVFALTELGSEEQKQRWLPVTDESRRAELLDQRPRELRALPVAVDHRQHLALQPRPARSPAPAANNPTGRHSSRSWK